MAPPIVPIDGAPPGRWPPSTRTPARTPATTATAAHTTAALRRPGETGSTGGCRSALRSAVGAATPRRRLATPRSPRALPASPGKRATAHENDGAPPAAALPRSRAASRRPPPGRTTARSVGPDENRVWSGPSATARAAARSAVAPGWAPAAPAGTSTRTSTSEKRVPVGPARPTAAASAGPTGVRATAPSSEAAEPGRSGPGSSARSHPVPATSPAHVRPTTAGPVPRSPGCATVGHGTRCSGRCHRRDHVGGIPSSLVDGRSTQWLAQRRPRSEPIRP